MFKKSLILIISIIICSCGTSPKKEAPIHDDSTENLEQTSETRPQLKKEPEINTVKEETPTVKEEASSIKEEVQTVEPDSKTEEIKPDAKSETNSNESYRQPITLPTKAQKKPKTVKLKSVNKLIGKLKFSNKTDAKMDSSIVFFKPDDGIYPPIKAESYDIKTKNKRFEPSVLAIPIGSEVKFPNLDRILHNVFSVSPESSFDLGLYSAGTVKSVEFDKAGIIYVHCNVHHSMQADILVLDTPWYSPVNQDGSFQLDGLPKKQGKLYIWHPRAKLSSQAIDTNVLKEMNFELKITRQKVPKHLNKFGKSYRPSRN